MKVQLLVILAVLLSSLLTISQRANAKEVSQLRWIEPSLDQRFCEAAVPDQDFGSDKSLLLVYSDYIPLNKALINRYISPIKISSNNCINQTEPRAPPIS
ncbi:hypothetical protein [Marinomonas posidonica]|uniref:Uncharacterized protein n=1 Tax=Marinomonas posidonica (strain CECT 7376 / NCIMB 14433 / IVIA-Po-181) TaxID=491952 RepID=F6D015_MARPP|nr:hypothetical protein [Marinomonas posidonica]AEF54755.1 hypothetical protein Mar181_1717 [Marinomonas posidonica IVIA-Po-181]